jgi:hypothetical protein
VRALRDVVVAAIVAKAVVVDMLQEAWALHLIDTVRGPCHHTVSSWLYTRNYQAEVK